MPKVSAAICSARRPGHFGWPLAFPGCANACFAALQTVVIDGRAHMLGRLASIVAKQILNGHKVVSVGRKRVEAPWQACWGGTGPASRGLPQQPPCGLMPGRPQPAGAAGARNVHGAASLATGSSAGGSELAPAPPAVRITMHGGSLRTWGEGRAPLCDPAWLLPSQVIVRCEEISISGGLVRQKMKYHRFLDKMHNTNPRRSGPWHYRAPSRIFWRTVRG